VSGAPAADFRSRFLDSRAASTALANEFGDNHCDPDVIEASLGMGDLDRARDLVDWMERVASTTGRAWTSAMAARSRGLVLATEGRLDEAQRALTEALAHHESLRRDGIEVVTAEGIAVRALADRAVRATC
jgi:hypothetical protein